MTGRHHADLIDGGERFRIAPPEPTPAHFPGKHELPKNPERTSVGMVWFSRGCNAWIRRREPRSKRTGGLEIIATPEEVRA